MQSRRHRCFVCPMFPRANDKLLSNQNATAEDEWTLSELIVHCPVGCVTISGITTRTKDTVNRFLKTLKTNLFSLHLSRSCQSIHRLFNWVVELADRARVLAIVNSSSKNLTAEPSSIGRMRENLVSVLQTNNRNSVLTVSVLFRVAEWTRLRYTQNDNFSVDFLIAVEAFEQLFGRSTTCDCVLLMQYYARGKKKNKNTLSMSTSGSSFVASSRAVICFCFSIFITRSQFVRFVPCSMRRNVVNLFIDRGDCVSRFMFSHCSLSPLRCLFNVYLRNHNR